MQHLLIKDCEIKLEIPGCNPGGGHYHAFIQLCDDIFTEINSIDRYNLRSKHKARMRKRRRNR